MHQKVKADTKPKYEIYTEKEPFNFNRHRQGINERLIGSLLDAYCQYEFEDSRELIPVRNFN
jgi:hypothetical protein